MRRSLTTFLCIKLALAPLPGIGAPEDLPDLGDAGGAVISNSEEYQLGRMVMRQLRDSGALVEEALIGEYIQSLGGKLSSNAHEGQHKFEFFVVDDSRINAFALPGGFIGIHHGLILATENESELAGVLGHEIAHVTQKHIARFIESSGQTSLMTSAAILAAVIIGGVTGAGSDAIQAAMAVAQGTAMQSQINFTRANEYEADRIGIGLVANSGFDARAVPTFFETLGRYNGLAGRRIPEFLQTHPISSDRVAEARNRIALLPQVDLEPSLDYQLIKSHLQVFSADLADNAVNEFLTRKPKKEKDWREADRYGYALALLRAGRAAEAWKHFETLRDNREGITAYHIGLARAQQAAGDTAIALNTYARAAELFPRNLPVTLYYGEALINAGQAKKAHLLLLDLVNNVKYTAPQVRLLALAASAAGDTGDAHYYMSEVHVLNGDLQLARGQLELALASPNLDGVQRARFQARLDEIVEHIPQRGRKRKARESNDDEFRSARR